MRERRSLILMAVVLAAFAVSGCQVGSLGRDNNAGEFIINTSGGLGTANTPPCQECCHL